MSRKKIRIKYKEIRSILSDMLPYEVPLTFTNRHFYKFLLKNDVHIENNCLIWKEGSGFVDEIILVLFGFRSHDNINSIVKIRTREPESYKQYPLGENKALIPFNYKINHKVNEFRDLSVPHPRSQLLVSNFYQQTKELIIYFSSLSPFSIRKPAKVAIYKFHKDKVHYEKLSEEDPSLVEETDKEYENLRSFFSYKEYGNIHKFYESPVFHRCEKKFNKLLKLDVSKCFDSIYTHSIAWAIYDKIVVKEAIKASTNSFAGKFDSLMQNMNYGETNGILIGPEFSRIFAEMILQAVDKNIETALAKEGLFNRRDYEIFRYVDDYFVFLDSSEHEELVVEAFSHSLKQFNLHLNLSKSEVYEKPIITGITIAKNKIAGLLDKEIKYDLQESEDENGDQFFKGNIYINSNALITAFKTVLKETSVAYKDILNYSLALVEKRVDLIVKNYSKIRKTPAVERQVAKAIISLLEFVFFIYSVSPRVNTTIRLSRVLKKVFSFIKGLSALYRGNIEGLVFSELSNFLKKNKTNYATQVETLYLLVSLAELGKNYWLDKELLKDYFGLKGNGVEGIENTFELNYFSVTVLFFYMKNKKRYADVKAWLEAYVLNKFSNNKDTLLKDAELCLLLFDVLTCPYINDEFKLQLVESYPQVLEANRQAFIDEFKGKESLRFTTWMDFDFGKELDAKRSQEVY